MASDATTLDKCFKQTATRLPERIFVRCGDRAISFAAADRHIDVIAATLAASGIAKGTRVAILLPNIAEFPLALLACWRIGALAIPVNIRYAGSEIADLLRRSRAAALITLDAAPDEGLLASLVDAVPGLVIADDGTLSGGDLPDLHHVTRFAEPASGPLPILPADTVPVQGGRAAVHDPVVAVYTSGTSGRPKGVVLTHGVIANCRNIIRGFRIGEGDRILGHMPLYHVAGLFAALAPAILTGATLVLVRRWNGDAVAGLIARERITVFGGIPTHYIDLLEAIDRAGQDMSSLRVAWIGGATISPELARAAKVRLGLESLQAIYGMTETTSTTTLSGYDDHIDTVCANKGQAIGDFEIGIFDAVTGAALPLGEQGEIRVRGHIVMAGYLDDPAATADAITPDGWFRTGDLGRMDARGYLQVTGRLKDVFRVGGSTVSPAEIERVLEAHDDVRQAIVVGAPDDRLGEVGFAFIEPRQPGIGRETIEAHCAARLAAFKRPRFIDFVDDFPMTSTGKIQRELLRQRACAIVSRQRVAETHNDKRRGQ